KQTENLLLTFQRQLQQFLSKADELHDCLISGQVPDYCVLPTFNLCKDHKSLYLELGALDCSVCLQLLDFSQQLCEKLEQLVLTFSDHGLVSVDETEPNSISHFCIGQTHLDRLKLSGFRYCKPTPYLSQSKTGLYKRMRWNVERPHDKHYFLCYEDIPNAHAEAGGGRDGVTHGDVVRMWSIGQWVQVNPDPKTEDLEDWILCEVPEGSYRRLLCLGQDEPSSRTATDHLQQLLLSCQPDYFYSIKSI
uniref:Si:ch211-214c7.5 n=1 Tax=Nothobranchius furzeri TaxID=105023 RepID=A0A8C6LPA7_NOTFU